MKYFFIEVNINPSAPCVNYDYTRYILHSASLSHSAVITHHFVVKKCKSSRVKEREAGEKLGREN